jgi:murein DD-endopeptidase MepM/ murein hydrolase activator NlpD
MTHCSNFLGLAAEANDDPPNRPRVTRGQLLGYVGNSGNSSAPHLHFQVQTRLDDTTTAGAPNTGVPLLLRNASTQLIDDVSTISGADLPPSAPDVHFLGVTAPGPDYPWPNYTPESLIAPTQIF